MGEMPPTSLVPYSSACWLWKVPCLPVNPWQMTRESPFSFRFTRVLLYCEPQRTLAVKPSKRNKKMEKKCIYIRFFHYQTFVLFCLFCGSHADLEHSQNFAHTSSHSSSFSLHPTRHTHTHIDRQTGPPHTVTAATSFSLKFYVILPINTIHIKNVSSCHLLRHSDSTNCLLSVTNRT